MKSVVNLDTPTKMFFKFKFNASTADEIIQAIIKGRRVEQYLDMTIMKIRTTYLLDKEASHRFFTVVYSEDGVASSIHESYETIRASKTYEGRKPFWTQPKTK